MKILAMSDTHLMCPFPSDLLDMAKKADIVVHAGDMNTLDAYNSLKAACKRLVVVSGNSDSPALNDLLPKTEVFEAGGTRFGVVHSGRHMSDLTNMRYLALELGVDVLIFGHLHRPIIDQTDVLLVCPGSPTYPRMSDPCVVEITVEDGRILGRVEKVTTGDVCGYLTFARSIDG
ncbi:MAG TPA: metallophosphoesterase [Methanocella sp.]|nr:metallophosphoesterase [Methanocella sp.]